MDFDREVSSVAMEASEKLPPTTETPVVQTDKIYELARLSPRGAVLEAWIDVETALEAAAKRYGLVDETTNTFHSRNVIFKLEVSSKIGRGVVEMFEKLRRLRNDAVHLKENSIDPKSAIDFVNIANRIVKSFEEA